jgi:2-polyprenyl-3-methyl-5-hydroxy-6-metoxy-1,4-benzoquinol methylase
METAVYDSLARQEDRHWWFEGRRRIVRELMTARLRPRDRRQILDVGCGTGGMLPVLQELGHVEGAEPSPDAIAYLNQRFPQVTIHRIALPDPLPEKQWHVITAFDVIEHLADPVACLASLRDRLVDDGQVVITVPAYQFLWSNHDVVHHHQRRYDRAMLAEHVAQAGLRLSYVTNFNTLLLPAIAGVRMVQRVLKREPRMTGDVSDTNGVVNAMLTWLFASERALLQVAPLPAGVSIFAIAEPA